MTEEIRTIEYTLRNIFEKDEITDEDVFNASVILKKWKILTNYKDDVEYPLSEPIIDEEPIYKNKKINNYETRRTISKISK
jgi:hypothetical protein